MSAVILLQNGGNCMEFLSIGRNIRKYRMAQNLRQEDLAEKTGLSVNYIGAIERGEKLPSLETFIDIANTLNVSADMLLCDVLNESYTIKNSLLAEKLEGIKRADREKIYDVIDTMIRHSEKEMM
jgi:transcriptional regulator with XRE-family HTH domain